MSTGWRPRGVATPPGGDPGTSGRTATRCIVGRQAVGPLVATPKARLVEGAPEVQVVEFQRLGHVPGSLRVQAKCSSAIQRCRTAQRRRGRVRDVGLYLGCSDVNQGWPAKSALFSNKCAVAGCGRAGLDTTSGVDPAPLATGPVSNSTSGNRSPLSSPAALVPASRKEAGPQSAPAWRCGPGCRFFEKTATFRRVDLSGGGCWAGSRASSPGPFRSEA